MRQKLLVQSQKDEISGPQEPDSDFTCEICVEPVNADNKFNYSGLCKHAFCSDCIAKYIAAKVVEFNASDIHCPALDCKFSLDPLSCRPILSNQLFDKWCELLCYATALLERNRSCYCPNPSCSALILNECNDKATKSTCPNCKKNFCFRCKTLWHAGYWCNDWRNYRDGNDILMGRLIEKEKWTRCPICGHAVQRNGGCVRIHCRCGHSFCHACGAVATDCRCRRRLYAYCICLVISLWILELFFFICFVSWIKS